MKERDVLRAVCKINAEHFGSDDAYSDIGEILKLMRFDGGGYFTYEVDGKVVAYLIYQEKEDSVHCVRRGVTHGCQKTGLGLKLTKQCIKLAHSKNKAYRTYCAHDNLASINSNIKCGCRVYGIDDWWIKLEKKPTAPKKSS